MCCGISTAHPTFVTCASLPGLPEPTGDPGQVPFHSVPFGLAWPGSHWPHPQVGAAYLVVTTSCRLASLSLPPRVNLNAPGPGNVFTLLFCGCPGSLSCQGICAIRRSLYVL